MTQDSQESSLESFCKNLLEHLHGELHWKWDDRFGTALAEFEVADSAKFRELLERHVGNAWDHSSIDSAPKVVQESCSQFGNLMPGQLLFASEQASDNVLFCAWWPWGNGVRVSIRIAPFQSDSSTLSKDEQTRLLKSCFEL